MGFQGMPLRSLWPRGWTDNRQAGTGLTHEERLEKLGQERAGAGNECVQVCVCVQMHVSMCVHVCTQVCTHVS